MVPRVSTMAMGLACSEGYVLEIGVMELWSNGVIRAFKPNTPTLHFALAGACRVALRALHQLPLAPFLPDALAFCLGLFDGILWAQHALGGLGEHDIEDPLLVDLVDGRVGVAG